MASRIANSSLANARPRGRKMCACLSVITLPWAAILCVVCKDFTAWASSSTAPCATDRRAVGDEYRILCPITGVLSPTKTVFELNGYPVASTPDGAFLQIKRLLVLKRLTVRHAGIYTCTVTDSLTRRVLGSLCRELIVSSTPLTRPIIDLTKASPPLKEVVPNTEEILLCPAPGANSAWWYKEGEVLEKPKSPSFRIQWNVTSMRLHFKSFLAIDEGNYSCKASNEFGSSDLAFFYRTHKRATEPKPKAFQKVRVSYTKGEHRFTWMLPGSRPPSQEPIRRWHINCSFPEQNLHFIDALPPSVLSYDPFSKPLLKRAFSDDTVMTTKILVRLTVRAESAYSLGNWSNTVQAYLPKPGVRAPNKQKRITVQYDLVSTNSCRSLKSNDFLFELPLEIGYLVRQHCRFCNASLPVRPVVLVNASLANCQFRSLKVRVTLFVQSSDPRVVFNTLLENLGTTISYAIHAIARTGDVAPGGGMSSTWQVVHLRVKDKSQSNTWALHDAHHHPGSTLTSPTATTSKLGSTTTPEVITTTQSPRPSVTNTAYGTAPLNVTRIPAIGQEASAGCMVSSSLSTATFCTLISAISTSSIV